MLCLYFHSVKRYTVHMNTKPCKKMSHRPIIRAPVTKHCYASIHRHEIGSNRSQQRGISIIYIDMQRGISITYIDMQRGISIIHIDMQRGISIIYIDMQRGTSIIYIDMQRGISIIYIDMQRGISIICIDMQRGISIIYIDMLYIYLSTPKWSRDMGRNNYLLSSSDVDIDVFNNQVKFRPVSCAVIIEPYSPGMWPITAGLLIRNMQWCLRQAHHITV